MKSDFERKEDLACLGEQLARLRREAGFDQSDLANHLKTGVPSISRLECGGTNPGWLTVKRYLGFLGYTIIFERDREHESDVR